MEINDADFFDIEPKRKDDDRDGDYWISMSTKGCGCCSESYYELHSEGYAKALLKLWINKKQEELRKLKKQLKELEEKE